MIRKKQGEIEWLEFEILADIPEIVHGVFLRRGGVSGGPFGSLNAGGATGDDPKAIEENRRRMLQALNMEHYHSGKQVHGADVAWVKGPKQEVGDCDALVTDKTGLGLMIKHADCQAAILYDPVHRALANVHSGWRGNVKNVYRATIEKMSQFFDTRPQDLLVGISPSLGPDHAQFKNYRTELPEEFWQFQVRPEFFDLWAVARHQFENCGVLAHHIEIAGICTYANTDDCFSYRREKVTGRHATIAMVKSGISNDF
jgi:YfiH family protein